MTAPALVLRHLCFSGPEKPSAKLNFDRGLNVIYGSSQTGKSFVLEAIDFMLGGDFDLRDIPQRVGYDRIFLALESTAGEAFTLVRSTSGGQFELYEGLLDALPVDAKGTVLKARHGASKEDNVSNLLLGKIGLSGKRIRKNADNVLQNLSLRNLCHFCLVNETEIQKQGSPVESGNPVAKTAEYSVFKLLLTGVDDSALVPSTREAAASQSRAAKIEMIEELITSCRQKVDDGEADQQELISQLDRLAVSIQRERGSLQSSEAGYQNLLGRRNEVRRRLGNASERRGEIDELRARFELLDEHYKSDLDRLEAIREAGSLMAALEPKKCPVCGALPEQQHRDDHCDGNVEQVVTAVDAESAKIVRLRRELAETVLQLGQEARSFDSLMPRLQREQQKFDENIEALRPGLTELRASYTELVEKRAAVAAGLALFEQLADLETRKKDLERVRETESSASQVAADLSSTTLDHFAQQVRKLLEFWHLPDTERAHFEEADRDLVIQGERRSSRGKGLRAITYAGFIVGLMDFCKLNSRQHPGFIVLDSPLLAYRAPEGAEDNLAGTDVQDKFYEHLAAMTDRQVIIIENLDPPAAIKARPTTTFFSKNPHQGRYGFFPISASAQSVPAIPNA